MDPPAPGTFHLDAFRGFDAEFRSSGGAVFRSRVCYFASDENGNMFLVLSSDKPAFYVFAEFADADAVFEDNSFTLLPDSPREIAFRTADPRGASELEKVLVVRHLRGSYEE